MKIYLIGYRCTGKSTIGKILANILHVPFMDTDRVIETQLKTSIASFVKDSGWDSFRKLERDVLMSTAGTGNHVIATGGGIILDPHNREFMKSSGVVVLLLAPIDVILDRMKADTSTAGSRPSLTSRDSYREAEDVLNERLPLYHLASHFHMDTSLLSANQAAQEIARRIDHGW